MSINLIAGVSKRKKHIKKLAEKKRNKHVQVAETNVNVETNINVEDNEESLWKNKRDVESDDEIIWGDDDLDRNQDNLFQILMVQMQNYILPTRRSTYTGNSARTKRRHHAQTKKDAEKNVINSLKTQLKEKNLDEGYKLRLTALLQYIRLFEFQDSKLKTSLSVAQQLKKGPWFARCLHL
ncbi:unnamed protein product [Rhizophagus irregularis]|nr:unnamed protein product [Rhizophagus irregularis]